MTIDEQQHLLILEKLLDTKGKKLYDHEYSNLVKDITGNSHNFIKKNLLANGYLEPIYVWTFYFSMSGYRCRGNKT